MTKAARSVAMGVGGFLALAVVIVAVAVLWPESPDHIVRRGSFEIYEFHHPGLGEPGYSHHELWCRGQRVARYPNDMWFNANEDGVIVVNAKDSPPDAPPPKGNGIYYFDARNAKQYLLAEGKYPALLGTEKWQSASGEWLNTNPWSQDGKLVVVSYGDRIALPTLRFRKESALVVDLDTGEVRKAAKLLGVDESQPILFRGWSLQDSTLVFTVGSEERRLGRVGGRGISGLGDRSLRPVAR